VRLQHRFDGPAGAPVLVLSNSLGTDLELWSANLTAWSSSFRVLRYDHRGHGGSDAPPGPYTIESLASDLLALLDGAGVERASFCGLSLGGAVGMWLAANAPERIDRLVLACTAARFGDPAAWHERADVVRRQGIDAIADAHLGRWFTRAFAEREPAVVAEFRERLVATPREGYAGCCEALAGWDFRERLGEVQAPTLVIAGADDPATPPERAALLADPIPNAKLVVLPDAAHLANVGQPAAFSQTVLDHIALQEAA
jgi:3-oxoadipate enol-lactonase